MNLAIEKVYTNSIKYQADSKSGDIVIISVIIPVEEEIIGVG